MAWSLHSLGYEAIVTELVATGAAAREADRAEAPGGKDPASSHGPWAVLMLGALGVVFGDIGTSPLYAMHTVFTLDGGRVHPSPVDVYGVVSLIFWSITLIVCVKYVLFVLRADNDGEGGVMALAALVRRVLSKSPARRLAMVMTLGVVGAALFYGDSVITPAISVLSAVEGLKVVSPGLGDIVVPLAAGILAVLFAVQRWGTARVGILFGPVMLLWFLAVGAAGVRGVAHDPSVFRGLSPSYAAVFIAEHPYTAFIAMGAIVLSITGAEALYADLSHFGRPPIRRSWFFIVFPALTLNYLAQGALILKTPSARSNPFYLLMPHWAQLPMVILATLATVIASQAVISGAFTVSRQAVRLGFLPHLRIRHTSSEQEGQVYVPGVNWGLFVAVLAVTLTFRASERLATAYGVAVTGTFLITTTLLLAVARVRWKWSRWQIAVVAVVFGAVELTFFAANLTKVAKGGWFTLLVAAAVFVVMTTWQRGQALVSAKRHRLEGPLSEFVDQVHADGILRVPGTAVFPHPTKETTPLALRENVDHNHVLHERVLIISGHTEDVPHVPWEERLVIDNLGDPDDGIVHVTAAFGFQDRADFQEVIRQLSDGTGKESDPVDPEQASYFLSSITLQRTRKRGMPAWRKVLFMALAHNAANQAEFLHLPLDRTVVMGAHIDL